MVERYRPKKNKYERWYDQLMDRARDRKRVLLGYFEKHHIVPKALGGDNSKTNIVRLTYREHFLAHWLLTKFTTGVDNQKMLAALAYMRLSSKGRITASWQIALARQAHAESVGILIEVAWKRPEYRKLQIDQASESMVNRWLDPVFRDFMETTISHRNRELWEDPNYRNKQEQTRSSLEFREGQRVKTKTLWEDPDYRGRCLAANTMAALRANPKLMRKQRRVHKAVMKALWKDPVWRANTLAARKAARLRAQ